MQLIASHLLLARSGRKDMHGHEQQGLIAIAHAHPNARVVANSAVSARRKVAKQKLAGLGMQIDSSSPFNSFLTMQFFSSF